MHTLSITKVHMPPPGGTTRRLFPIIKSYKICGYVKNVCFFNHILDSVLGLSEYRCNTFYYLLQNMLFVLG